MDIKNNNELKEKIKELIKIYDIEPHRFEEYRKRRQIYEVNREMDIKRGTNSYKTFRKLIKHYGVYLDNVPIDWIGLNGPGLSNNAIVDLIQVLIAAEDTWISAAVRLLDPEWSVSKDEDWDWFERLTLNELDNLMGELYSTIKHLFEKFESGLSEEIIWGFDRDLIIKAFLYMYGDYYFMCPTIIKYIEEFGAVLGPEFTAWWMTHHDRSLWNNSDRFEL